MSVKLLLFTIFNSIFFFCGIFVICVGIYSRLEYGNWRDIISGVDILQAANTLIAVGVFVALIGFLGCFGAWKESLAERSTYLMAYAIFVPFIFIIEVAAGINAYENKKDLQKQFETGLNNAVKISYGKTDTAAMASTKAVDWFQKNVRCCGSARPSDWKTSDWFKAVTNNAAIVPTSCCLKVTTGCNEGKNITSLGNQIYTVGCIEQGKDFLEDNLRIISKVRICISVIALTGMLCAILLCREIKLKCAISYNIPRELNEISA